MLQRNDELGVHRQKQHEVHFSGTNQFGEIGQIHVEESLKELPDQLMCPDEEHHLPFRPVADSPDISKHHLDKNDLPHEPQHLHEHPEKEIELETHLPDQGVAEHDAVDLPQVKKTTTFRSWSRHRFH